MKKMIGLVVFCVVGLAVSMAFAQIAALESAVAPEGAAVASASQEITIQGKVSVVNGPDGALQFIFINPLEGHGYKVDLVNGVGMTLADKGGKIVKATGVDANRLFTIQTATEVE